MEQDKDLSREWLYTRTKGVSYTDMCIWIDKNIHDPDCDVDTAYKYIWLLANMLACKAKYFINFNDYQNFSSYLATDVFLRLRNKEKKPIKSVLNYMKSILYFRKCMYCDETFSEVIDVSRSQYDNFNEDLFKDRFKNSLESYNHVTLELIIGDILEAMPEIIKSNISDSYKVNKRIYENIYISALLSSLNRIVLSNDKLEYLHSKHTKQSKFDDIKFYSKNKDSDLILWHLPKELESVVNVIVNRSYNSIINSIKEAIDYTKIDDDEYISVLASGFFGESVDD